MGLIPTPARLVRRFRSAAVVPALLAAHAALHAQNRGAARLQFLVRGLTVTPRVLVIGAHPDDEDSQLIAWLSRGRAVQTAYLSLTRGEGGQNFLGAESGPLLGAIRTEELLAARRIDGGELYFARAYDFGPARSPEEVFKRWDHEALLGDVVAIVRSFRPHVLVAVFADSKYEDGQHLALGVLGREAFESAGDTVRFPTARFGFPWAPLKFYRHGPGVTIDARIYDPVIGKTYAELATETRALQRSQGFAVPPRRDGGLPLHLTASRLTAGAQEQREQSIFDGIDTSFARLAAGQADDVGRAIPLLVAFADSARRALDLQRPTSVVMYLARVARTANELRGLAPWCRHPSQDAAPPAAGTDASKCGAHSVDLDASIDLVQRRASEALLAAAGIAIEATADRELVVDGDTVLVSVNITNFGDAPVTLGNVTVSGSQASSVKPIDIAPGKTYTAYRTVTGIPDARPWWITKRDGDLFPSVDSPIDGLARPGVLLRLVSTPGVAVPEGIRRQSDVTVSLSIAGTTVSTSIGPVVYRQADARLGVRDHPVSGAPAVTIVLQHALEWVPIGKPLNRPLRVTLKSFSDSAKTFRINVVSPAGVRLDSVPASVTLAPREQRELNLRMRGGMTSGREPFGIIGIAPAGARYFEGFGMLEYSHIQPVRFFQQSAMWLQAVQVAVPPRLSVVYVRGVGEDLAPALRQVGIPVADVAAEDLIAVDLSQFTAILIGSGAYGAHRELVEQNRRLLAFVSKGGTLVVLPTDATTMQSGVVPYPVQYARPFAERVTDPLAAVTVLSPGARLLEWPNAIRAADWKEWVSERALFVPTVVDIRYAKLVELHDPEQPENRNALLVARLGKGSYVYTTLTLGTQIAGGVPGALRILVNLLSAGLVRGRAPGSF